MNHSEPRSQTDWLSCDLLPRRRQALSFLSKQPPKIAFKTAMERHGRYGGLWAKKIASEQFNREQNRELNYLRLNRGWWLSPGSDQLNRSEAPLGVLRGRGVLPHGCRIGIVGARRANSYGCRLAHRLAQRTVDVGGVVVSGGAYGIDISSHRAALESGGRTVVVLGSGLKYPTPTAHHSTFEAAVECGAIVSPFPCHQRGTRWTYVERNAWIAALCDHLIVVQATRRSGALHTARAALQRRRHVWIVPGAFDDDLHAGCHRLVAEGARILTSTTEWDASGPCVQDVSADFEESRVSQVSFNRPGHHYDVWEAIGSGAGTLTALADTLTIPLAELVSAVTELEMSGWIRREFDGSIIRDWPDV